MDTAPRGTRGGRIKQSYHGRGTQDSGVRKLQYIAELERRVSMGSADFSVRVASLLQTRATLSLENSQMKQQMATLKQDKLIRKCGFGDAFRCGTCPYKLTLSQDFLQADI